MGDLPQAQRDVSSLLREAYERFRVGGFEQATQELEKALAIDYERSEVLNALKCANYWDDKVGRYKTITGDYEKGEYLLRQWKSFIGFLNGSEDEFEQGLFATKQWVFGEALTHFLALLQGHAASDPEILHRVGRCYKGKGDYQQAVEYFEACSHQRTDDPQILAELADCYALINEEKAAKAFFREAFFLDPQAVDVETFDSLLIQRLIERVGEFGYEKSSLVEWIPVYGVVFGVFNIKRELRSLELGKLKQSIFAIESRLEDGEEDHQLEPRLINRYFWLIDHHISSGDSREKVDEILVKLKNLNKEIYEQYVH